MRYNKMAFLSTGVVALFCIIAAAVEFAAGSIANGCIAISVMLLAGTLLTIKLRLRSQHQVDSTLA